MRMYWPYTDGYHFRRCLRIRCAVSQTASPGRCRRRIRRSCTLQSVHELDRIARRAMVEYGLEADFSDGALRQAQAQEPAPQAGDDTRDLRGLLWSSIDNDDSRDLDQL